MKHHSDVENKTLPMLKLLYNLQYHILEVPLSLQLLESPLGRLESSILHLKQTKINQCTQSDCEQSETI